MALPIQDITQKLVQLLEVQYIYKTEITEGNPQKLLIIVLRGRCSTLTTELADTVGKIFQEQTDFLYRIFSMEYAGEQLKEKNLFFIHGCLPHKLIYKGEEDAPGLLPYTVDEVVKDRLTARFKNEAIKTGAFIEGAAYYIKRIRHSHAAFMLHQYIELNLRFATLFIMGRERKRHSIKELQNGIKAFAPELGCIFNTEIEEETLLLKILDDAYIATRYRNDYHITENQLMLIYERAQGIATLIREQYNHRLKGITHPPQQEKQSDGVVLYPTTGDTLLQEIIARLQEYITLDSVYVMGKKKEMHTQEVYMAPAHYHPVYRMSYTLLILTEGYSAIPVTRIVKAIGKKLPEACYIYPIVYNAGEAWEKVDFGCNFLSRAMGQSALAYYTSENPVPMQYMPVRYPRVWKRICKKWKSHFSRCKNINRRAELNEYDYRTDPVARVAMMHYALEQVCLGLLYVFWEFEPKIHTLPYLMHLCSHFTDIPDTVFPRTTYYNNYLYHLLCKGHKIMRHKTDTCITKEDAEEAYKIANRFIDKARQIAKQELERLKKLHKVLPPAASVHPGGAGALSGLR
ncbi:HEPN domain-containing protein [Sinomicrobium weinanense]|uniref:HEPN domain-containing protein n=1 Tax=Sinomicrobium weinanense TaxID=2842200 RepID=A0A926JSQ7_9FLAO|nr:HEPN domain-containing protein [Sinomicrobium weinanense]MBC9796798.1 HEPN domain-containing protein [Sinomicrobium weinanense]MBU3125515.1 HEPN domain-containing protein [Sinomicrobium weinanense]